MIRAALLSLVVLLAACDRKVEASAFTSPRLPPNLATRFWPPDGWAYGVIQLKDAPPLRYGVAVPQGEARADVIILPAHGESAEIWFETARALIADDYAVWILDGAGEGGSGRSGAARDLADNPDFETDVQGLIALHRKVMRPKRQTVVIASGTAAMPALTAVQRGFRPASLILSGPFEPRNQAWKRPQASDRQTARRRALAAWALVNPDLRMGKVSARWEQAHGKLATEALSPVALARVKTKVLVISPGADALPCEHMPDCGSRTLEAADAYQYSADITWKQWLVTIFETLPR